MLRTLCAVVAVGSLLTASAEAIGQSPARAAAKPAAAAGGVININTASAADFESLPGIGAKTAARIIEYRQKNGPFKKIEELMNVQGVGEKSFLKLKPQLTITSPRPDHTDGR